MASLSLVSFHHLSALSQGRLISYINIYITISWSTLYHIIFFPISGQLEFSSLEVKYDKFKNGDEWTLQKPLVILATKDRWSEHLMYITDVVQPEETSRWKNINTHNTHTHTHTITHTHMHAHTHSHQQIFWWKLGKIANFKEKFLY